VTDAERLSSLLGASALAALLAVPTPARCTEAVVLASTAPGYELGRVIPNDSAVSLPEGTTATFLLTLGQTLRISGPFEGALLPPGGGSRALLALEAGGTDQRTIAGTRMAGGGPVEAVRNPATVAVDPGRTATYCLRPQDSVLLLRPAEAEAVELRDAASSAAVRAEWPAGASKRSWPAELPLTDGTTIQTSLRASGSDQVAELTFRMFETSFGHDTLWAATLALSGCTGQAQALLATLRDSEVPLDLYLTTDRGRFPTYRLGEPITLTVQTNRDAFLYCVIRQPDGRGIALFPSRLSGGARIGADRPLTLPGERLPVPLRAGTPPGAPPGDNEVRCIAADRDVSDAIPPEFSTADFNSVPGNAETALRHALARLPGTQLAEVRLVVRVQ
jgi:hypothetical protein